MAPAKVAQKGEEGNARLVRSGQTVGFCEGAEGTAWSTITLYEDNTRSAKGTEFTHSTAFTRSTQAVCQDL